MPGKPPFPNHYDAQRVDEVRQVPYQIIAESARSWAAEHSIAPACEDTFRICLIAVDVQNTFCIPGFELFVSGRSGMAAVEDNRRLVEFIYRNLSHLTQIVPTLDTHQAMQIFHSLFFVDAEGRHPAPFTRITREDIRSRRWRLNEAGAAPLNRDLSYLNAYLDYYTRRLEVSGKYDLTIWPYHAMLGGVGHALVPAVEEALFFHAMARYSQPDFHMKGSHPLTEHYSVFRPEVDRDHRGQTLGAGETGLFRKLEAFDAVIIAGQAKSHCVAYTISDLLNSILETDRKGVEKVYLLEDCTSPVVIPGVVDFTEQADGAFAEFQQAGMHVVRSVDPLASWPGIMGARLEKS